MRFNLLQYVVPEVKELYNWLEVDFHPLKLSGRVTKVNNLDNKENIHLCSCFACILHYGHLINLLFTYWRYVW